MPPDEPELEELEEDEDVPPLELEDEDVPPLEELDEAVLPSPQKDSVSVSGHSVVRAAQTPSTHAAARNWFSPFEQLQHVGAQSS